MSEFDEKRNRAADGSLAKAPLAHPDIFMALSLLRPPASFASWSLSAVYHSLSCWWRPRPPASVSPPFNLSKTKWLCVFPLLAEPSRTDLESTGVDRLGQGSRSHVTSSSCIRNHLCPFTVAKRVSQFRLLHVVANTGCCRCVRFYYNWVLSGISPHTPSDTHELEFFYAPIGR